MAGEYKVIGNNPDSMATQGVTLFYQYTDIFLGNGSDELVLLDDQGREVDRVEWDNGATFPDPVGQSMQWDETGDNNVGSNWFGFGNGPTFGDGDIGTPGAANDVSSTAPPGAALSTGLGVNRPNPFNPMTTFSFTLDRREHATLQVFTVRGERVRTIVDRELDAGRHTEFTWDGTDEAGRRVTSGTYIYRLETASGFRESKKLTVLK